MTTGIHIDLSLRPSKLEIAVTSIIILVVTMVAAGFAGQALASFI